jgi:hypothetical protein
VMEDGQLVESGPHDELLARGGRYAELRALQHRDDTAPFRADAGSRLDVRDAGVGES